MSFQSYIKEKGFTVYSLSKKSRVPKTTVTDLCSGKSKIEGCRAETLYRLALALNCSMEDLMMHSRVRSLGKNGEGEDSFLECSLPEYLLDAIEKMQASWEIVDREGDDIHWDIWWSNLSAEINSAEVEQDITSEQAWYLRRKYLRMKTEEGI